MWKKLHVVRSLVALAAEGRLLMIILQTTFEFVCSWITISHKSIHCATCLSINYYETCQLVIEVTRCQVEAFFQHVIPLIIYIILV